MQHSDKTFSFFLPSKYEKIVCNEKFILEQPFPHPEILAFSERGALCKANIGLIQVVT
jgi:hypothetical protein